jgi:hypothetical protein
MNEIISFVVKFLSQPALNVNFEAYIKVWNRSRFICDILYLNFNKIYANNIVIKLLIIQWNSEEREIKSPGYLLLVFLEKSFHVFQGYIG